MRGSRVRGRPSWLAALAVVLVGTAPLSALGQDDSEDESSEDTETSADDEDSPGTSADDEDSPGDPGESEPETTPPPAEGAPPVEEVPPEASEAVLLPEADEAHAEDGYTASNRQLKRRRAQRARTSVSTAHHERKQRRFSVGFRGTGLAAFHKGHDPAALGGPGGFVEFAAVHGELELELAARVLVQEASLHIPIDFLLKKPWELKRARLYLGVGPALVVGVDLGEGAAAEASDGDHAGAADEPQAPTLHFGFAGVGGVTYWVRERVGFNAELNYNIVIHEGATHELGASVGLVFVL